MGQSRQSDDFKEPSNMEIMNTINRIPGKYLIALIT